MSKLGDLVSEAQMITEHIRALAHGAQLALHEVESQIARVDGMNAPAAIGTVDNLLDVIDLRRRELFQLLDRLAVAELKARAAA